jgi:NADH dehydrogenase
VRWRGDLAEALKMPARVVVLGGGFAGVSFVRELKRLDPRGERASVTLVNRENFMLFTPMLPEVASGGIETRDIARPLRAMLRDVEFELGEVSSLDVAARTVTTRHPLTRESKTIAFDELVIALGSTTSDFGVPGVSEHALPLKVIEDASKIHSHVLGTLEVAAETRDRVERDRLLRFVIVGGGFTGVEATGELLGFLKSVARYYPALEDASIECVLVEGGKSLLAHLPPKFGKRAAASLRRRGVRLHLGDKVASVDADGVTMKSGTRFDSRSVIWSAGTVPSPLAKRVGLQTDEHGAISVAGDFSVKGTPHAWALGDCAAVPKPKGGTYAPLAQNAIREGPALAENLLASLDGKPTKNFRYRVLGQMASLGDRQGLALLPGGHMISGLPAWILWRVYYLGRLPGWGNKVRVATNWTLEMALPPDLARLPAAGGGDTSFEDSHAVSQ